MNEPVCAQQAPYQLELEPGTYWWCACGQSKRQPLCDGSHKGSGFTPVRLDVAETKVFWLCGCKHTARAPHCDGTHKQL